MLIMFLNVFISHQFIDTQPEAGHSTEVTPWQRGQGTPVLHFGEVENQGNAGDEDEVEETHRGKEMSCLAQIGTAKEHLKQHLSGTKRFCWKCISTRNTKGVFYDHQCASLLCLLSKLTALTLQSAEVEAEPTAKATPINESPWKPSAYAIMTMPVMAIMAATI